MSDDEIIEMAREAGFGEPINHNDWHLPFSAVKAFAKLVADKARQELREEVIYTWVPPSFVDFAIKTEREACAKEAEKWAVGANIAEEIRARGEA